MSPQFLHFMNNQHPTIKIKWDFSFETSRSVEFLDVKVWVHSEGYIQTDLYVKPNFRNNYLLSSSCNPAHIFKNLPYFLQQGRIVQILVASSKLAQTRRIRLKYHHKKEYKGNHSQNFLKRLYRMLLAFFLSLHNFRMQVLGFFRKILIMQQLPVQNQNFQSIHGTVCLQEPETQSGYAQIYEMECVQVTQFGLQSISVQNECNPYYQLVSSFGF